MGEVKGVESLNDVIELEGRTFESYEMLFKKYVRDLLKIKPNIRKIEIYEDTSSSDCPTTYLYFENEDEEVFLSDLEHSENNELVKIVQELEELICLWLKRFADYFDDEEIIMGDPIPVEIIID